MIDVKNHGRVAVLFKEEVRKFNEQNIAGCERVFVEDVHFLNSVKMLGGVYMAARDDGAPKRGKLIFRKIPYSHKFLDSISLLVPKLPVIQRQTARINKTLLLLAQLLYAISFIVKEFRAEFYYVIQVPLVALFFPKKTTVIYHNFYSDLEYVFKLLYFFQKDAEKIKLVFVSESLFRQYSNKYPLITRSKCFILHNSVDIKEFKPAPKKNKKISFVFLSAWVKVKGVHLLPKIIKEVNKKYKDNVEFVIGGSVGLWSLSDRVYKEHKKIEDMVNNLASKFPNVKVIGLVNHSDIPSILSAATFCLLPSTWPEPCSLLVSESLACGAPVIAFDVGGNREIINSGKNGYLVKDTNVNSMIRFINNVVIKNFNQVEYRLLSNNARLSAEKYSSLDRNKHLVEILMS